MLPRLLLQLKLHNRAYNIRQARSPRQPIWFSLQPLARQATNNCSTRSKRLRWLRNNLPASIIHRRVIWKWSVVSSVWRSLNFSKHLKARWDPNLCRALRSHRWPRTPSTQTMLKWNWTSELNIWQLRAHAPLLKNLSLDWQARQTQQKFAQNTC